MMKKEMRTCSRCGKSELTFSRVSQCLLCGKEEAREKLVVRDRALLESMYDSVVGPQKNKHQQRIWTFTHSKCGTTQVWTMANVQKQLATRPDSVPCTKCGGKERMSKALAGYVEKYGRDFDVEKWLDYRKLVRRLTEATYRKFKSEINPLDLKRGMKDWHLDHKMPIIRGFIEGLPPEALADRSNLQMLPAFDNISKGRKTWQEKENTLSLDT